MSLKTPGATAWGLARVGAIPALLISLAAAALALPVPTKIAAAPAATSATAAPTKSGELSAPGTSAEPAEPAEPMDPVERVLPVGKGREAETTGTTAPGGTTWAERLGYPAGARVLLLHADDIGMCFEANAAAKAYLEAGEIQSAAAMVPCPWFDEFAAWYKEHPDKDVGLHLALTSEWRFYRWGPVAPRSEVPGLLDPDGYLFRGVPDVATHASADEVKRELRAQVERALSRGIRPGHIDTHMGTLYARLDYTKAYFEIAQEYDIPAMAIELTDEVFQEFLSQGYPFTDETRKLCAEYKLPKLDAFHAAPSGETYEDKKEKLLELLRALKPGITEIIFHPSVETDGLRRITGSWQQRVWEARLFSDPEVKAFFEKEKLLFTSWKEMMRRHRVAR